MRTELLQFLDSHPKHIKQLGIALLIFGLFVSVLSFTLIPPAEHTERVTTEKGMTEHTVETQATVLTDTPVYDKGETVTNSPLYSRHSMSDPSIQVSATKYPNGTDTIHHSVSLVLDGRYQNTTYHKESVVLTESTEKKTAIKLNITEVESAAKNIHNLYNQTGTVYAELQIQTVYEYNGKDITINSKMPIKVNSKGVYSIGTGKSISTQSYDFYGEETEYSQMESSLPYLLFSGALGVLGLILVLSSLFVIDPTRTKSDYLIHKHSEWVTKTPEYTSPAEKEQVQVSELLDLIELAIDMDNRVIYDLSTDTFIVETDLKQFVFEP